MSDEKKYIPECVFVDCQINIGYLWKPTEIQTISHKVAELSFLLDSLNWYQQTLAQLASDIENWANPELPKSFDHEYRDHSIQIAKISSALAAQLTEIATDINHYKPSEKEQSPKVLDLSEQPTANGETIDIAANLSKALNNPQVTDDCKKVITEILGGKTNE